MADALLKPDADVGHDAVGSARLLPALRRIVPPWSVAVALLFATLVCSARFS